MPVRDVQQHKATKEKGRRGTCKLCLDPNAELQYSHVLPRALYRLLRGSPKDGNPNPWIVQGNVQVQTSRQERDYLLCHACEQRLNRNGERWVFTNGLRPDGTFPLASILAQSRALSEPHRSSHKIYFAGRIPGIDVTAIAYFAASIFWRASIHVWKDAENPVKLGPYEESFRSYLMGESAFPQGAVLTVRVRVANPASGLCHFPSRMRHVDGVWAHSFTMPGFTFYLFTGKVMPGYMVRSCMVNGVGNPVTISDSMEGLLVNQAARVLFTVRKVGGRRR